jgi:osmotically-inducible protein OsmY
MACRLLLSVSGFFFHPKEYAVRERHHDYQSERERRSGGGQEREGSRGRGEQQRFASRDWRDDEGFGDESESQGFEGRAGQGGWREDQGAYGNYGQSGRQGDPFRQPGGPYGGGGFLGRGQGGDYGQQRESGRQGWERRQESGIERNEGYGGQQGYGSQRYGQGYGSERLGYGSEGSQRFGSQGQGFGQEQRGRFTGRGPKGWQRSDESILERVNEALEQHPEIDASEIEVTCSSGEIVLRGTVAERRAKRLAEDAIENLPGVKDVRNEIRVQQERQGQQQGQPGQQTGGQGAQQTGRDNGGGRTRSAT